MLSWALFERHDEEDASSDLQQVRIQEAFALKDQGSFFCPDCFEEVFPKKGVTISSHFSHQSGAQDLCRLRRGASTSQLHRNIQQLLFSLLGGDPDAAIEHFFPSLNRRADLVHFPSKTVYEIQVSSIRPEVAVGRTLSYWKEGWKVLWIFSTERFPPSHMPDVRAAFITCGIPYYYYEHGIVDVVPANVVPLSLFTTSFYKKTISGSFIPLQRTLVLPHERLVYWLMARKGNATLPIIFENIAIRQELWPYCLDEDLLSSDKESPNIVMAPSMPSFSYVTKLVMEWARNIWLDTLCKI